MLTDLCRQQGCCGVIGYQDYAYFSWNNSFTVNGVTINNAVVPPSCCIQATQYAVASNTSEFVNLPSCLTSAPLYTNTLVIMYALYTMMFACSKTNGIVVCKQAIAVDSSWVSSGSLFASWLSIFNIGGAI